MTPKHRGPECIGTQGEDIVHIKVDGDMVTVRPLFTKEANDDAEKQINSNGYFFNIQGGNMNTDGKDFFITAYNLTHLWNKDNFQLKDGNRVKPKYSLI